MDSVIQFNRSRKIGLSDSGVGHGDNVTFEHLAIAVGEDRSRARRPTLTTEDTEEKQE
jgi:hypothetical protein